MVLVLRHCQQILSVKTTLYLIPALLWLVLTHVELRNCPVLGTETVGLLPLCSVVYPNLYFHGKNSPIIMQSVSPKSAYVISLLARDSVIPMICGYISSTIMFNSFFLFIMLLAFKHTHLIPDYDVFLCSPLHLLSSCTFLALFDKTPYPTSLNIVLFPISYIAHLSDVSTLTRLLLLLSAPQDESKLDPDII